MAGRCVSFYSLSERERESRQGGKRRGAHVFLSRSISEKITHNKSIYNLRRRQNPCDSHVEGSLVSLSLIALPLHTMGPKRIAAEENCYNTTFSDDFVRLIRSNLEAAGYLRSDNGNDDTNDEQHNHGNAALLPSDGLLQLDGFHHLCISLIDVIRGFFHLCFDLIQ